MLFIEQEDLAGGLGGGGAKERGRRLLAWRGVTRDLKRMMMVECQMECVSTSRCV